MTQDTKPKDDQKLGLDLKSSLTFSYFFKHILSFLPFLPFFTTVVKVKDFLWLLRVEQQQSIIVESRTAAAKHYCLLSFLSTAAGWGSFAPLCVLRAGDTFMQRRSISTFVVKKKQYLLVLHRMFSYARRSTLHPGHLVGGS